MECDKVHMLSENGAMVHPPPGQPYENHMAFQPPVNQPQFSGNPPQFSGNPGQLVNPGQPVINVPNVVVMLQNQEPKPDVPPVPISRFKSVGSAYIFWLPFGIFGLHHFYLKNTWMGVAYALTIGLFGVGWLVDVFRIPMLVKDANSQIAAQWVWEHQPCCVTQASNARFKRDPIKRLSDCYLYGFLLGWLGMHHHYLGRHGFGVLYLCTFGLFGIGYIVDWFRMPCLLMRCKEEMANKKAGIVVPKKYRLDDAYILAFPGGIFGFHNFYLGRPLWGLLYVFTFGMFGIGWLIDLARMPLLVNEANIRLKLKMASQLNLGAQPGYQSNGVPAVVHQDIYYQPQLAGPSAPVQSRAPPAAVITASQVPHQGAQFQPIQPAGFNPNMAPVNEPPPPYGQPPPPAGVSVVGNYEYK